MGSNKAFIASTIFITFFAIFFVLSNYKTSYEEVDISNHIRNIELKLSQNQEIIVFNSKNPFSFNDLLFRYKYISNQKAYAILTIPNNYKSTNKLPVVLGVAGSKGWGEHHYGYMDRYLEAGFATVTLHSFSSRNVSSTVGEQVSATTAMLVHDSYKVLEILSNDKRLDADNIGITGWSLGGGVSFFTAWKPVKDALSPNYAFAAHLPIYPPCMVIPDNLSFTTSPIHILIGEDDNWVPADACIEMVEIAELDNLNITTYPEAHHSFDRNQELIHVKDAYSFTDCRLKLTDDGIVRTLGLGIPLSNSILQKSILAFCADRGATYGGNKEAREHSSQFALSFMDKHLRAGVR